MIKISKLADYAVVVLAALENSETLTTAPSLARETNLPEPTVAKVLKLLAATDMVNSMRGAAGGYRLARPFAAISIAEIITAIDGPIALTACVDGQEHCNFYGACAIKGRWDHINAAIYKTLSEISLKEVTQNCHPRGGGGAARTSLPDARLRGHDTVGEAA